MINIIDLITNKETIVRKRITNFIEKLFNHIKFEFYHDRFKKVVYCEDGFITESEIKMKMAYDSFMYLVFNRRNTLTKNILSTFMFIYFGKEIDNTIIVKLTNTYFKLYDLPPIEKALKFHLDIYNSLKDYDYNDRLIISLFFFNYILITNNIPCIQLLKNEIIKYEEIRDKNDLSRLNMFFIDVIFNQSYQDKSFYKNIKEISYKDIYNTIYNLKEIINNKYMIKKIYLYGSFVKGLNRIDSDIDLIVEFNLDCLVEEKELLKKELTQYLQSIFNRYVDIHEISGYLSDDFLRKNKKIKEIV